VNENIVIVLDSGIDIVTYYFKFFVVRMPSVSCRSRRLACSGRVNWLSKQVLPLTGGVDGPSLGGVTLCFRGQFSTPTG